MPHLTLDERDARNAAIKAEYFETDHSVRDICDEIRDQPLRPCIGSSMAESGARIKRDCIRGRGWSPLRRRRQMRQ